MLFKKYFTKKKVSLIIKVIEGDKNDKLVLHFRWTSNEFKLYISNLWYSATQISMLLQVIYAEVKEYKIIILQIYTLSFIFNHLTKKVSAFVISINLNTLSYYNKRN